MSAQGLQEDTLTISSAPENLQVCVAGKDTEASVAGL